MYSLTKTRDCKVIVRRERIGVATAAYVVMFLLGTPVLMLLLQFPAAALLVGVARSDIIAMLLGFLCSYALIKCVMDVYSRVQRFIAKHTDAVVIGEDEFDLQYEMCNATWSRGHIPADMGERVFTTHDVIRADDVPPERRDIESINEWFEWMQRLGEFGKSKD